MASLSSALERLSVNPNPGYLPATDPFAEAYEAFNQEAPELVSPPSSPSKSRSKFNAYTVFNGWNMGVFREWYVQLLNNLHLQNFKLCAGG
jgi:hypothetical protein